MTLQATFILKNISELLTMLPPDEQRGFPGQFESEREGLPIQELGLLRNAAIAVNVDKIIWMGAELNLPQYVAVGPQTVIHSAQGKIAMPGLIDCHTHLVFAGNRAREFYDKLNGKPYQEIAQEGGGIQQTVRATRQASPELLFELGRQRLQEMLKYGITTVEIKSGYGLDFENEVKILRVVQKLKSSSQVSCIPTFLGAHVVPLEFTKNRARYVDILTQDLIPYVAEEKLAEFCDVFCEQGAFSLAETEQIFATATACGLQLKIHTDQFNNMGGCQLAARFKAISADHLDKATVSDLIALREAKVTGVLLPGCTFFMNLKERPAYRLMKENGLKVAIATDFNPGSSMSYNLQLMTTLATIYFKMPVQDVLTAITREAAYAVHRESELGRLKPGMKADILVLKSAEFLDLPYFFGINHVAGVIKNGKVVFTNE